jgi:tetratricopeptide (TPR) repeat protein
MNEAASSLDRAVKLAPNNRDCYLLRGGIRINRDAQEMVIRRVVGRPFDGNETLKSMFANQDYQKAASLSPDSPRMIAVATGMILADCAANRKTTVITDFRQPISWPADVRAVVDERNKQLERLMSHDDGLIAADARCFRALNHVMVDKELSRAATLLRETLKRRPEHNLSFDLLCTTLSLLSEWKELQTVAEARLSMKGRDDIWTRYPAARAAFELKQYDRAEKHLRAGLQADPKSCLGNLALASVLIKSYDKSRSDEIRELLFRADINIPPPSFGSMTFQSDASLLRSIFCALDGDVGFARRNLRELLEREPHNEKAAKIAKVLGQ